MSRSQRYPKSRSTRFRTGDGNCPGISREMVRKELRELRDGGVIELQGKVRGARWLRVKEVET